ITPPNNKWTSLNNPYTLSFQTTDDAAKKVKNAANKPVAATVLNTLTVDIPTTWVVRADNGANGASDSGTDLQLTDDNLKNLTLRGALQFANANDNIVDTIVFDQSKIDATHPIILSRGFLPIKDSVVIQGDGPRNSGAGAAGVVLDDNMDHDFAVNVAG